MVKAYTTRVGRRPLPTEQHIEHGEELQPIGREFRVTTSRTRLDLVIVKYSTAVKQYTALHLTRLAIMDGFPEIQVVTAYQLEGRVGESLTPSQQICTA